MVNLQLKEISMRYEKKYILDNLDLDVQHGELLVLLGESGCGKTTLLKIIAGIIEPENGKLFMEKKEISKLSPQKRKVGYVPQAQVLFPHMTVRKNIAFGLEAHKLSKSEIEQKIKWAAELTHIEELLGRYPSEISGGQKQRVALSRAIAIDPHLLLLDEPLSSIDTSGREELALTIRRIQKETETTTIYVTHNQEEARLISDRVAIMYDGKIQQIGRVVEIDHSPANYLIAKIMGTPNIWSVQYQDKKQNKTIVTTELGKIELPYLVKQRFTGVRLPPSCFEIAFDKNELQEDIKKTKMVFKGIIKSIIERDIRTNRMIVEVKRDSIEYIKVDIDRQKLKKNLETNQQVIIYIDTSEVQIL